LSSLLLLLLLVLLLRAEQTNNFSGDISSRTISATTTIYCERAAVAEEE
jgi:hypothetical protein